MGYSVRVDGCGTKKASRCLMIVVGVEPPPFSSSTVGWVATSPSMHTAPWHSAMTLFVSFPSSCLEVRQLSEATKDAKQTQLHHLDYQFPKPSQPSQSQPRCEATRSCTTQTTYFVRWIYSLMPGARHRTSRMERQENILLL